MFGFPIGNGNAGFNDFVEKFTNNADSGFPKIQQREVFYSVKDGNWNDISIWQTASGRVGILPTANDDVYIRNNVACNINTVIYSLNVSGILTINASITLGLNYKFIGAGNSQLINIGTLNFLTQISAEESYSNGIYDITSFANTIGFTGNYDCIIPAYYNTFNSLSISGTGTKTLGVNTTLNGNLSISLSGFLECSTYDLTVTGTTTTDNSSILSKNSTGNLLFIGKLQSSGIGGGRISFSGNPNVEFRNGISISRSPTFVTGTGTWSFTTNNQTFTDDAINQLYQLNCAIVIASGITLTMGSSATGIAFTSGYKINSTLNGSSGTSTLVNRIGLTLTSGIMSTGVIDITTFANSLTYSYSTTLPYSSYHALGVTAASTVTAASNLTLTQLYVQGTLQLSTYNLTVNGVTNMANAGTILKSGAGNVLFVGAIQNVTTINTSGGNANVECRGGISGTGGGNFSCGTGVFSFTTNNQSIISLGPTFNSKVLISGAITVTFGASGYTTIFNDSVDGDNANSKLLIAASASVNYKSATQPMATGILDTSTNLNTWIYGLNNQDIKGGLTILTKQVYRNLTLNGTGVKTLQGYVSVQNTYTLTAPATLALNGFTLTNP
jgi:hypothetical protein